MPASGREWKIDAENKWLVRCNTYIFAANPSKSPLIQGEISKLPPLGKGGLRGVRFRCYMVLEGLFRRRVKKYELKLKEAIDIMKHLENPTQNNNQTKRGNV
jgi:hypothetical protein